MRKNIVLIGMPGCGKSEIGAGLAKRLGMEFVDADAYIEEHWGRIPELFKLGEAHFRDIESRAVAAVSLKRNCVIATGGGVVLREQNMQALKRNGIVVFIDRPLSRLLDVVDTSYRPLLAEGSHKLAELYEQRLPLYRKYADRIVDNSGTLEDAVAAAVSATKEE
jgi:shikimate kinase